MCVYVCVYVCVVMRACAFVSMRVRQRVCAFTCNTTRSDHERKCVREKRQREGLRRQGRKKKISQETKR